MKRIASFVGIAVALAATPASSQQRVTIQWQTANLTESQYEPIWKRTIAEFEAANPDVRVEPILVARRDHWTKFVAAAQARQAPCVVSVDLTTAAAEGYLRPLDDFWAREPAAFRDAWSQEMLAASRWQGKLYGIPNWGGTYAEIYNRELVGRAR
jgi:ABC-type glycerol-3-phosphate transport system substrate-binding protein